MSSVDLKGMASELAEAQKFLAQWWADKGLEESERFPFELALEELFVNVASYGSGELGTPCNVKLTLQQGAGRIEDGNDAVTLTIQDNGPPFNPVNNETPDLSASISERDVGGLGIHLTRSVMDSIDYHYEDGFNKTSVSKKINI